MKQKSTYVEPKGIRYIDVAEKVQRKRAYIDSILKLGSARDGIIKAGKDRCSP